VWLVPLLFASLLAQDAYAVWSSTPFDAGDRLAYAWRETQALLGYRLGVFR